jgi:hypothetical protein
MVAHNKYKVEHNECQHNECQYRLYTNLTSDNWEKYVRIGCPFDLSDRATLRSKDLN